MINKRYGMNNALAKIKEVLIGAMYGSLRDIKSGLINISKQLTLLTPSLADNMDETCRKQQFVVTMSYILTRVLTDSINATGHNINISRDIGMVFDKFIAETSALDPFSSVNLSDARIKDIISSFDSYAPSEAAPVLKIVQRCLSDESTQPIRKILQYVEVCTQRIIDLIMDVTKNSIASKRLDTYPVELNEYNTSISDFKKLQEFMLKSTEEILAKFKQEAIFIVRNHLAVQENQIGWFKISDVESALDNDNGSFESSLNDNGGYEDDDQTSTNVVSQTFSASQLKSRALTYSIRDQRGPNIRPSDIRCILKVVFKSIVVKGQEITHKTIIASIIKQFEHKHFIEMMKRIYDMSDIDTLFYDSTETIKMKNKYADMQNEIKALIETYDNLSDYDNSR